MDLIDFKHFNITMVLHQYNQRIFWILWIGNSSVAYFGHQLEVGSYATSYIPTQGSAVTRLADTCDNGANEQVINSTEGVLYFERLVFNNECTVDNISINDGSQHNLDISSNG